MSFWEFGMVAEGWYDDNSDPGKTEPPTLEEMDDQIRRLGE